VVNEVLQQGQVELECPRELLEYLVYHVEPLHEHGREVFAGLIEHGGRKQH
jgi:hypothetical protein